MQRMIISKPPDGRFSPRQSLAPQHSRPDFLYYMGNWWESHLSRELPDSWNQRIFWTNIVIMLHHDLWHQCIHEHIKIKWALPRCLMRIVLMIAHIVYMCGCHTLSSYDMCTYNDLPPMFAMYVSTIYGIPNGLHTFMHQLCGYKELLHDIHIISL